MSFFQPQGILKLTRAQRDLRGRETIRRATLFHNPNTGEGFAGFALWDLARALEARGYQATYHSSAEEGWEHNLDDLDGGALDLGRGLPGARRVTLDIGLVEGWPGRQKFMEARGTGGFARTIIAAHSGTLPEPESSTRELRRNNRLLQATLAGTDPAPFTVIAYGEDLSGEYLMVEAMNTPFLGPNMPVAPHAHPSDGLLGLVLVSKRDETTLERPIVDDEARAPQPGRPIRVTLSIQPRRPPERGAGA